jgi:uncharacterized protein
MSEHIIDPQGTRLPIKVDSTTNGEIMPVPISAAAKLGNEIAHDRAGKNAKRAGLDRRSFMVSTCGAASALMAFNEAHALGERPGGHFAINPDASVDAELADATLGKTEFIFDIQGHFVDPKGKWLEAVPVSANPFEGMPKANCDLKHDPGDRSYLNCLNGEEFVKDIFLDSDTDMMVLTFVPSTRENEPLTIDEAHNVRQIVEDMEGTKRLLVHGRVNPNQAGDLEGMDELAERWNVAAWKTYTQWGPDGTGFYMDDAPGIAMIEKAQKLGIKNICIHKGLPFGPKSYEHSTCVDIGRVAKRYPDINFIIYHSGYDPSVKEKAFEEGSGRGGVDTLVQSLLDNEIAPNSNVYAELGSTWRMWMQDPTQAAHGMGKLLKACGQDNVLWGTDSIWYGSPQDQIQAMRAFQIGEDFQDKHGYANLTADLKAKIFGLNATKPYGISMEEVTLRASNDAITKARANYAEAPSPHFQTHGPKNRREFFNLLNWNGGSRL